MNKKLNISAIIPKELYVQRDADRKLKEVIQLMSKPAYISVSRQMGKTNLLINAKRELQNENNRYVFIDITGSFTSSQDCFRYIVNQILDSNEDIEAFETASQVINSKRKESINRSSTEEFQSEIRTILKYFKGNLIIFLDEVDDLVKHSFSDEIFGQIRKTYFIRETYDVLKRVTYVLSGVIDPEKLIKSKENSPFNIAIPIYLQDFTYDEFKEFVFKSNLPLTEDIEEYIYDWLSGNPRMTFDVLSQIEDEYITNNVVNKQLVDNVIQTIYLDSYKQPPVDHIRDLVKHDTEVRTALISLKKGNINELSDSSVNKLYLFGIVKSKIKSSISIKNKVIEACLSDDWLEKVELEKKGYLDYGEDKMSQGLYKEAIFYFNEYINNNQTNKSLVNLAKYNIGKAYYNSRDFKKALEYLSPKPIKKETSAEIYFLQILYLGISHFKIGQLEDALKMYDEVLNDCSSPNTVVTAMMNKGELMFTQQMKDYENAILIHTSTIEYIEKNKDDIVEYNYSKTIANYRMGYAYYELKNKNDALPYFEKALETADKKYRPEILLFIDSCLDTTRSERHSFFTKIANEIIDNKITFDINDNSIIQFPEYHLHFCLLNLYEYKQIDEYEKLLDYSIKNIYLYKISFAELIYKVASFSFGLQQYKDGTELLLHVINRDDSTLRIKKDCYLLLSMGTSKAEDIFKKPYISYLLEYIDIFSSNNNFGESVELGDVNAFLNAVTYYRENNDLKKSFEIALTISNYYNDQLANDTKASYAFVYFFIIDYLSSIGNLNGVQQYGEKALEVISKINPFLNDLSYIDKKHLNNIEQRVKAMMDTGKRVKVVEPVKIDRKIGRNEYVTVRYKDGGRITTKFKKVEHDIRNGECIIDEG